MVDTRAPIRTWHHRQFAAADLAAQKLAAGLRVSVIIPAHNEQATIGGIVRHIRRRLVDAVPLVDELLVVDSESTDATARTARDAGARVVRQNAVLPEAGPGRGKGEALWKGLAATDGDLVVFLDADIRDFDDRFVVGLLGPLLTDPDAAFVKAFYDRPLVVRDELRPGGGRVTELVARPLLASFWPELSWLVQPLAGEYAARRWLLEQLPIVQGYGVEFALLVDICERFSADLIAQVDLERRVHDNKPLPELGPMATEILQVAFDRLVSQGRATLDAIHRLLPQPVRDDSGAIRFETHRISIAERPPLARWRAQLAAGGSAGS